MNKCVYTYVLKIAKYVFKIKKYYIRNNYAINIETNVFKNKKF